VRIISGSAGGIPLTVPKGADTRPTQDKVRGAIFSMLGELVNEARVLDLFAGSGSLGIEALSRGAASCVFVEKDRRCVESLRANLAKAHLSTLATVWQWDSLQALTKEHSQFDLIFADPPYYKHGDTKAEAEFHGKFFPAVTEKLSSTGWLVYEHYKSFIPSNLPGLELAKHKIYGETGVSLYRRRISTDDTLEQKTV